MAINLKSTAVSYLVHYHCVFKFFLLQFFVGYYCMLLHSVRFFFSFFFYLNMFVLEPFWHLYHLNWT